MKISRPTLFGLALLLFATALWLHWPAAGGGFLTRMDDDEYLRQAVRLKGLNADAVRWAFTATEPYYNPLPRLSFVLDYQLWGPSARGFHLVNVGLHALNTALLFGFLWTLLGAMSLTLRERLAVAFGVAAVFAIHPQQVESVAWIASRVGLLCTLCEIACVWAYVAGARRWIVWLCFALALLCKPTAVSLLFTLFAVDYFPLRRHEQVGWIRLVREKAVLIALAAASAVTTMLTEAHGGGLLQPLNAVTPLQRVFLALQSLAFYPWKLLWPAWLSPYYPVGLGFSLQPAAVAVSVLLVTAATGVSLWRWRRTPALIAVWGAYVMFILPVSGLMLRGWQAAADRYAYVAMIPLLLLAGGGLVWLWRRGAALVQLGLLGLLAVAFGFFGWRARAQIAVWHNDESLWRGVLAHYPDSAAADEMLAQTLLSQNRVGEALACARRAAQSQPSAETHRNLGIALTKAGRPGEAVAEFTLALRCDPALADTHRYLALTLVGLDRLPEAVAQWREAVRLDPGDADAQCNFAILLQKTGQTDEALQHYHEALRLQPGYAEAHYNLGVALVQTGRVAGAIAEWREAVRLKPDYAEAQCNLGVAMEQTGRPEEAVKHYEEALRIRPDLASVHYNLGVVLLGLGRGPEAVAHWEQALKLNPDFAAAHYNIGVVCEQTGRNREAIAHYEQALRIRPGYPAAEARLMRLLSGQ